MFEKFQLVGAEIDAQVIPLGVTVKLNRNQMALLFDRDVKTIGKHINTVLNEGELEEKLVVAKFATTEIRYPVRNESQEPSTRYIENCRPSLSMQPCSTEIT